MKPRVVVVDDSLTVRMDLVEAFEAAGFAPDACADLAAARRALAAGRVALIVLDVMLPDGSGVDFLRELRARPDGERIPVMILSSEAEVRRRVEGIRAGADEFVGKPYDITQLIARAGRLVAPAAAAGDAARHRAVLVIDDSATFRHELGARLAAAGYDVTGAASGEEGLALAATRGFDAIVVDGVLPGIDGATVVRRLKADAALRGTPCLLMTAAEDAAAELRSLEAGADAHVRKSDDLDVLLVRIAALLRSAPSAGRDVAPGLLSPKRLLAVDDSVTYLEALGDQLRAEGYDLVTATSGAEALELLQTQAVDAILLDLVMPGLSGEETCRRIKATPAWRDIPLVMLTGREDREAMIAGINAGADDYIGKAADFDVLKARLRAQLRRKHFEDEHRRVREQLVRRETDERYARALEQTNAELAAAIERAETESTFKSRFLASMSHELRTPLNAVIGFSELLYDQRFGPLNPRQLDYVENVLAGGRHLLELVNDILDLSRIAAGRMELHREDTSLRAIIDAVTRLCQPLLDKRRQTLTTTLPPALPPLDLDPLRIQQVLHNLVSNAIKFSPPGTAIELTVTMTDGLVAVACKDHGIGISAEDLPRLFREFERIEHAGPDRPEGTGLGLALTRRLVELHGGTIDVVSAPGQGSTFTFTLPRA